MPDKEFFSCLALRCTPGIGPKTWKKIFRQYSCAYKAFSDAASWHDKKLTGPKVARAVQNEVWREDAEAEFKASKTRKMKVLTWFDPLFPERLRNIPDPPVLLYYSGDISLLGNPGVAIVGARKCTEFGLDAAGRIGRELSQNGITVISGMACGIDRQAHLAGLEGVGSSIAVLGTGLDVRYPASNLDLREGLCAKGLIVTEYAPGVKPDSNNFPHRNRIISGLSLGVLVAEAANKSGSLITARLAGEQGRDVFALPGPLGQPTFIGCHRLIKQGAALVECGQDIIRELSLELSSVLPKTKTQAGEFGSGVDEPEEISLPAMPRAKEEKRPEKDLQGAELELFSVLPEDEKTHIDKVIRALGWDSSKVSGTMLMLEMRGLVRQWPGMYYSRV